MNQLKEFIEFWLGPRKRAYGESVRQLKTRSLPEPLQQFYAFAGRWPSPSLLNGRNRKFKEPGSVNPFTCWNRFCSLDSIADEDDGKICFWHESQGINRLVTETTGVDPPVWIRGDGGDQCVPDRLSWQLISVCLEGLLHTSPLLSDPNAGSLYQEFMENRKRARLLFRYGKSVTEEFWIYRERFLVGNIGGTICIGSNCEEDGRRFLSASSK